MSIITNITGMPLFTTIQEAIDWGRGRGLSGYHEHIVNGVVGYMGGATHAAAVPKANEVIPSSSVPPVNLRPIPVQRARATTSGSSGSSGGGGGGGY
tara:strand:+ start:667 stop:957 length:291 start_codon:yes stop_codon:yes gene_type:complete